MASQTKNTINTNFSASYLTLSSASFKISQEGNDLKFYDVSNPAGITLASAVGSGGQFTDGGSTLKTTASLSIDGSNAYVSSYGSDVYLYVSGTRGLTGATAKNVLFNGDVRVSGSLTIGTASISITSNDIQFGTASVRIERSGNNIKFFDVSNPTGKTLTDVITTSTSIVDYSALPSPGTIGNRAFVNGAFYEFVDDGTYFRPNLNGVLGYKPPASSSFTEYGTRTVYEDFSGSLHAMKDSTGVAVEMFIATQAVTGSSFWVEVAVICHNAHTASSIPAAGIILRESGTGKFGSLYFYKNAANVPILGTGIWTSPTTRASSVDYGNIPFRQDPLFFRAKYDGTNVAYEYSHNRKYWKTIQTTAKASIFTTAPNEVGICVLAYNVDADVFFPHYYVG